jgi:hypothetical protein
MRSPEAILTDERPRSEAVLLHLKNGLELHVFPARASAHQVLAGEAPYAAAAWAVRAAIVRNSAGGLKPGHKEFTADQARQAASLVAWALATSYPTATAEEADAWAEAVAADREAFAAVIQVACGRVVSTVERSPQEAQQTALAVAWAGMGDAPLTAEQAGALAERARHTLEAPPIPAQG